ncbi:uncharacterized protein LOC111378583 [Olea europaea var. sylvestris]|uniref:uncharacterized protein LOC111378583 n=1 Tax=Olea europaea var. sylvestris TaxID=158386 RepID=UPI000C1D7BDB|nr:uncharacterized protein LOC111378583 [Olea europaea var. sylvestris]
MHTAAKVLQSGFYWPNLFKDCYAFVKTCDCCQRTGNISRHHELPLTNMLEVELFDVWGIDFMVDYASKWVEAIASPTNDAKVVLRFLQKNIFTRFGMPRAIVSDEGTHFCNKLFNSLLAKYDVKHKLALGYHPQSNGQAESLKHQLECHPTVWYSGKLAVKKLNLDMKLAGPQRLLQLDELEKFRNDAYENTKIYKERTKKWHDKRILSRDFKARERVLLFNFRLKLFPGKLKSRWSGPFVIRKVFSYDAVELVSMDGSTFQANGQRLKHYYGEENRDVEEITLDEPT